MDSDFSEFTGSDLVFDYFYLSAHFTEEGCQSYCNTLRGKYAKFTKAWTDDLHSEWLARNYLAVKMILSATVMLTSLEFCKKKNVRIVEPYLAYYATISCARALIFTLPEQRLVNTDLYEMTHQKIINVASDTLKNVSKELGNRSKQIFENLRSDRELFSYKFPAEGIRHCDQDSKVSFESVVDFCSLLSELAQLHSECLESSVTKNVTMDFTINPEIVRRCFQYDSDYETIIDDDDVYRIWQMSKHKHKPCNLRSTATEGLVEDFFCSWTSREDLEDSYDPDKNWRLIFPFD